MGTIEHNLFTTRDIVYSFFQLNEYFIKIYDTPGLIYDSQNSRIERKVLERCRIVIKNSDIILIVCRHGYVTKKDRKIINFCLSLKKYFIIVMNQGNLPCNYVVNN